MKIIFLDVDGVLNGYGLGMNLIVQINKILHIPPKYIRRIHDPFGVHTIKVKRLAKIVKATGAKVVMSSTWRFVFFDPKYESNDVVKLRKMFDKYGIECIDQTPNLKGSRRETEIYNWICRFVNNGGELESFVILDDESFRIPDIFAENFVKTSNVPNNSIIIGDWRERTGLKPKHVRKAIDILNRKK